MWKTRAFKSAYVNGLDRLWKTKIFIDVGGLGCLGLGQEVRPRINCHIVITA